MNQVLNAALDEAVKASVGRLATGGISGALNALRRLKGRKINRDANDPGGSVEQRHEAYANFLQSISEIRNALGVLVTGPPSIVGAIWTWPVHLRLLNNSPRLANRTMSAFLNVELVGQSTSIKAAEDVMEAVTKVFLNFPSGARKSRSSERAASERSLTELDEKLAQFTMTARAELGFGSA